MSLPSPVGGRSSSAARGDGHLLDREPGAPQAAKTVHDVVGHGGVHQQLPGVPGLSKPRNVSRTQARSVAADRAARLPGRAGHHVGRRRGRHPRGEPAAGQHRQLVGQREAPLHQDLAGSPAPRPTRWRRAGAPGCRARAGEPCRRWDARSVERDVVRSRERQPSGSGQRSDPGCPWSWSTAASPAPRPTATRPTRRRRLSPPAAARRGSGADVWGGVAPAQSVSSHPRPPSGQGSLKIELESWALIHTAASSAATLPLPARGS